MNRSVTTTAVAIALLALVGCGSTPVDKVAAPPAQSAAAETTAPAEEAEPEPEPEPEPEYTLAQKNAIRSAESYLAFTAFSRAGLIRQLTSEYGEGFELADAEFAVSTLEASGGVDWNEQAVRSAESYLDFSSFSRQGLYDQLTSEYGEQFTHEQAEYALSAVGY